MADKRVVVIGNGYVVDLRLLQAMHKKIEAMPEDKRLEMAIGVGTDIGIGLPAHPFKSVSENKE